MSLWVFLIALFQLTDGLIFKETNLELIRPVIVGETVIIDCQTDEEAAILKFVKKENNTEKEIEIDNDSLKLLDQTFYLRISSKRDNGEYACKVKLGSSHLERGLTIYVTESVFGNLPKPIVSNKLNFIHFGSSLSIQCTTQGTFAKLSWTKENSSTIDLNVKTKQYYEDGSVMLKSTLILNNVTHQDVGVYFCSSSSTFDGTRSSAEAQVRINVDEVSWRENKPLVYNAVTVNRDLTAILSCTLSDPLIPVKFFRVKNGIEEEIKITEKKYFLINNQELAIAEASQSDYGLYLCKANYPKLSPKEIRLFVNTMAAVKQYISVLPRFLQLEYYEDASISCVTYGNDPQLNWFKEANVESRELVPVSTESIKKTFYKTPQGIYEKKWTLQLTKVVENAKYLCSVTQNGSVIFSDSTVTVKAPLSPQIKKFESQKVAQGSKISLVCKAKGSPRPAISFFKDSVPLTETTTGYIINGKRLTIVEPLYPENDGLYRCKAENMFGTTFVDATLVVIVNPILDKSETIIVANHWKQLQVKCKVLQSNPQSKISWEYQPWSCPSNQNNCAPIESNWKKVSPTNVVPPMSTITTNSLFTVPESDVSKFFVRCVADNDHGRDVHQVIAMVDHKNTSNALITQPEKIAVDQHSTFTLVCKGQAGFFTNLTWYKDNVALNNPRYSIDQTGSAFQTMVSRLTVSNSRPKDAGEYNCLGELSRMHGKESLQMESRSHVTIKRVYGPTIYSIGSSSLNNNTTIIHCNVDSHPQSGVIWYKDGKVLDNIDQLLNLNACRSSVEGKYFEVVANSVDSFGVNNFSLVICKHNWRVNNGTYTCSAMNEFGIVKNTTEVFIPGLPTILENHFDAFVKVGRGYFANCTADGNPAPRVWWEKGNKRGFRRISENVTISESILNLTEISENDYGSYRCMAKNSFGSVYKKLRLWRPLIVSAYVSEVRVVTIPIIAIGVVGLLVVILLTMVSVVLFKRRRLYGGFYLLTVPPAPDYFKKLDPTKSISEQTHKLPYFPEWEFPRSKVKLKDCVGSGAFGEVYLADAIGITSFDPRYRINLKHKAFVTRFSLARSDTIYSSKRFFKSSKGAPQPVAVKRLKEGATDVEYKDLISEMKILIHIGQQDNIVNLLGACTKGVESDTMVILEYCPHGNLLSFMKARRSTFQPVWLKAHNNMEKELSMFDLCVAVYQIAKGLNYLASRKCVHRDVAARNVLVGDNFTMKVADFGLARDVYEDARYVKLSGGLLPVKWMAIESIFDRVFTHQSDVWSYGVLLWEVMTLGGSPYPGLPTSKLPEYLKSGHRMNQPQFCPNEIYALMLDCWNENPALRPTFNDVVACSARVVESHCKPEEVELYLDKCHISGVANNSDYLLPIVPQPGSYNFSGPPSYLQSFGDPLHSNDSADLFQRQSSQRYVQENFTSDVKTPGPYDYEQAVDSSTLTSPGTFDDSCLEATEMTPLYQNGDLITNEPNVGRKTPSPVSKLSRYIDNEYKNMEGYANE